MSQSANECASVSARCVKLQISSGQQTVVDMCVENRDSAVQSSLYSRMNEVGRCLTGLLLCSVNYSTMRGAGSTLLPQQTSFMRESGRWAEVKLL